MARLCLFSPALAIALRPGQLRALERRVGPLPPMDFSAPLSVARAFFARRLSEPLADVLDDVERFATVLGLEALLEAGRAIGQTAPAWREASPLDAALAVVLRARRKAGLAERRILKRARVRLDRYFSPNTSYEVVARAPASSLTAEAPLRAGREAHGASLVEAWAAEEAGVIYGAFLHLGLAETIVQVKDGALVRRTARPLRCDRVRCDLRRMRVGFQLVRAPLLPAWIASFAGALGDPGALAATPSFTLRVLHERGAGWLAAAPLPAGIRTVIVVGCELDDGTRVSVRSPQALADLHRQLGASGGYLLRVTLRFFFEGGAHADATIELPSKLTLSDLRREAAIREALDTLTLTTPGALGDDLPSLAPFEHPAWRWVALLGPAVFEHAVARGLLVRSSASRRAGDAAHRSYGSSLIVHDIPGEETKYALGEDLAVHAYDAPAEAAVRWKLDQARFASELAARLGLTEARLKRRAPPGLLPLGRLTLQDLDACIFQQMRIVREAEADELREELRLACGAALPVVLVGRGRPLGGGTAQVQVDVARLFDQTELGDALERIADALGVEAPVEGWRFGAPDRPLVLLRERGEAWFGKVRLKITANQFGVLLGLARTPGEWVTAVELGQRVSAKAAIVDQVVRKARVGFAERVTQSFEEAGVAMPAGLPERILEVDKARGCYRLGVGVVVR
ncbi:MAG TPA: hypothetical protein VGI39_27180 [Polyangiaceae bacterium]